jgi:hypothetical protein
MKTKILRVADLRSSLPAGRGDAIISELGVA